MEESSKTMEKSSKTMERWSETLGKSRKMVCRGAFGEALEHWIEGSTQAASVSSWGLFLSTCICWAQMWDHYEEKALLDGPSSEVHLGRR